MGQLEHQVTARRDDDGCPDDAVVEVEGGGKLVDGGAEDDARVDVVVVADMAGDGAGYAAHDVLAAARSRWSWRALARNKDSRTVGP